MAEETIMSAEDSGLDALETPCLLLDADRLQANVATMRARLDAHGVVLRPHLKTAKSLDVARVAMASAAGPATVSTLREAEYFAAGGVRDIIYAVGIAPQKLERVGRIRRLWPVDLAIVLDSLEQAEAVAAWGRHSGDRLPVLIEVDADGHRSGVNPADAARLAAIGRILDAGAILRGVLLHAGDSYGLNEPNALRAAAEAERVAAVTAAAALRSAGLPCPVVSVGSTPTARYAETLDGITEVRAGVFMIGDLFQAGVGSCAVDDIALTVLTTVIGHQREKGWIITDAGWMALSRDRGTARQPVDQGYGLACDRDGIPYPDLIVSDANQEHGILALRKGAKARLPELSIGTRLRILPNHACATGAQHDRYHVIAGGRLTGAVWPRINGW
ncbi:D-serine deaminase, pyridoxal phosphate-dependent [Methylobacterium phyllostachyos]|uniref:D-serine deaminase, pyridoxal phosphate-dependent n=1 Tax=Methylobacterium phyllostachyos TaxID=582672 RepID=A0A1G9VGA5_9HYPH|nr:alanine racemase [Methylobacterium phyllostachyos]SDM71234.1 D-serine deaminase, pyridoxal phosphate-dependent [Methylobacterium phyllostachyos]